MTDLHTHLLPGIDDGAQSLEESETLLKLQKQNGVSRVMMTPHFYSDKMDLNEFTVRRNRAYQETLTIYNSLDMPEIKLGAEVRYSPVLMDLDLSRLTLGDSSYILLELPNRHYPAHLEQVISNLGMMGYTPILAHLERYIYFREQPELLFQLIQKGALGQISILSLFEKETKSFAKACLKNSLAHLVASDAHNAGTRPPCMAKVREALPPELIDSAESFARCVWENEMTPFFRAAPVKKRLFGYT